MECNEELSQISWNSFSLSTASCGGGAAGGAQLGGGWAGSGHTIKAGCRKLFSPFVKLAKAPTHIHCSQIPLQPSNRASAHPRKPCCTSEVVNNGCAHAFHALPVPERGLGWHAAQARGCKRRQAQDAGARVHCSGPLAPSSNVTVGISAATARRADGPLHPGAQRNGPGCGALQPAEGELQLRGLCLALQGAQRPAMARLIQPLPSLRGPDRRPGCVQAEYSKRLAEQLGTERPNARILAFKNKACPSPC